VNIKKILSANRRVVYALCVVLVFSILFSCSSNSNISVDETTNKIPELIELSKDELDDKIDSRETFYIYFGRPSCPDCVIFEPKLKELVKTSKYDIYYFNTEAKASKKKEMREYIVSYGINEVPSILDIQKGDVIKVYDGQTDRDIQMLESKLVKEV
jgi:predicted bacteriocin transport accessory protein